MATSFLRRFLGDFILGLKEGYAEEPSEQPAKEGAKKSKPQTTKSSKSKPVAQTESSDRLYAPHKIADAILEFEPFSLSRPPTRISHSELFRRWGNSSRFVSDDATHSNAFLFGVISDRMIKAEQAWALPFRLADRLGHLDVNRIRKMKPVELEKLLTVSPALHRFNRAMAEAFIEASERLVSRWGGAASNIWPDGSVASEILAELEEFKGISHKLSAMTLQCLITQIGARIDGLSDVNIAVDRHVARVFLRTGLVSGEPGRRVYRSAELKPLVIQAARKQVPLFPGALDLGAFWIGKNWCTHTTPRCTECPLSAACPKNRLDWAVGIENGSRTRAE